MNTETEEIHTAVVTTSGPNLTPISFDLAKADIEHMRHEAESLTIAGPDDETGYKTLSRFRIDVLKAQRINIEDKIEQLIRPHLDYAKDVKAVGGELVTSLKEIENGCSLKEKAYKDERERLARERMLAQQQRTEGRVNSLRAYGFEWHAPSETYEFERKELEVNICINFEDIKELSDADYQPTADEAYAAHQAEVKHIAQQVETKRVEDARIAKEQQDERDRLKKEQDELKAQQAELKAQQEAVLQREREMDAERKRIDDLNTAEWEREYRQKEEAKIIAEEKAQEKADALAEKARLKADKERTARLKPEKKEFASYLKLCYQTTDLNFQQPEIIELLGLFAAQIEGVVDEFRGKLDAL
jgi:hypothetical protein